jgi:prevent-host-death family protein
VEKEMKDVVTITEAKAKLSEIINRVHIRKDTISITKKGKPAAILLPIEEYENLRNQKKEGLIMAKGVLASLDVEIDRMTESIYKSREKETTRSVSL